MNRRNRKAINRDKLNALRLILLDWDPMDLFMMGQAGLEEYDEHLPKLAERLSDFSNVDELTSFLTTYATEQMDAEPDPEATRTAAEKLHRLKLD